MSSQQRLVTAIASLCLLTITCASAAADTSASSLVGSYQHEQSIIVLNSDGTYLGTTPKGEDWVKGKYTQKGNELTVVDTWEGDSIASEDCKGKVGRYTWAKTAKTLTMHVVNDPCNGRRSGTDGVAWAQIEPVAQ